MRKIVAIICLSLLSLSCKKSKNEEITACGVVNPIQNLNWLNQKYKLFTGGPKLNSVLLYEYNGSQIIQFNQAVSSKMYDLYNCNGELLMFDDASGLSKYLAGRKKVAVIYGTFQVD